MISYQIVSADTPHGLEAEVLTEMEKGWRPTGGVCVAGGTRTSHGKRGTFEYVAVEFFQAMVTKEVVE